MSKIKWILCFFILFSSAWASPSGKYDDCPTANQIIYNATTPIPQRDKKFIDFLSVSVQIRVSGSMGSGSIIYYDKEKNLAYVASCGHLWSPGTMSSNSGQKLTCTIVAFYHNDKKLKHAKRYSGNVKFYTYIHGVQDTSLITFTPDWEPEYFPIAPLDYQYQRNEHVHSLGCDGGSEVANYDVVIQGISGRHVITQTNSPRGGRSGGGLFDDQYYIGTCWGNGSTNYDGEGIFTSLNTIHQFWTQQGYDFLLNIPPSCFIAVKKIPIIDRSGSGKKYSKEYILIPSNYVKE